MSNLSHLPLGVAAIRRWLLPCFAVALLGAVPGNAKTGYSALDDAAVAVKAPGRTPLIAVARAGNRLFAAGMHGVIVFSDDNAASWRQAQVPVDVTLTAIYFSTLQTGWAVGHYGVILQTEDGGLTWHVAANGLDVIGALDQVAATSQLHPSSATDTALKQRVAAAFQAAGPNKPFLAAGACGHGVLADGQQDMAMFTGDSGRTWTSWTAEIDNPNFNNVYAILSEPNATFLIGERGMVLKGDANCANFVSVAGPFAATLFTALAVQPGMIVLAGLDGGVFKSGDDGKNWRDLTVSSDSPFVAAVQLASGKVLLGTVGGTFYASDSNISKFTPLALATPAPISGMILAPNGDLVTVGLGGARVILSRSLR